MQEPGEWEALMLAAQGGDSRAYDRLLRAILPLLRGVARRRINDPAEAEDAVQDALLTIHQLRHAYDATRPLRPWLIADLPLAQRTALRLAKLDDLSLAEASARSGMSVGALKVATHRAVKALRKRLGQED